MNNPAIPDKTILFEPVNDSYGTRLALVFGNERGKCPFYDAKQCYHCDIGAGEGTKFTPELNKERLDFFKDYYGSALENVQHLIIYNSGSTLDKIEMSQETLKNILTYASSLEKCKVVSLDSREMFVTEDNLDYVVNNLREDQKIRIILGVESQSDEIRMGNLNKSMTKQGIEKAFENIGKYNKVGVDMNIVFQPPELKGKASIQEAVDTLKYGLELGNKYNVPVDFNFHPYYTTKKSKAIFPNHTRADIEDAKKALTAMKKEIGSRESNSTIFIGWQDEEHDQEQHQRKEELEGMIKKFDSFNTSQDVGCLD